MFFDVLSVLFHVTYNKENELKPIKKLHERAIFYYVVMPVPIEALPEKNATTTTTTIIITKPTCDTSANCLYLSRCICLGVCALAFKNGATLTLSTCDMIADTLMCARLSIKDTHRAL